MVNLEHKLTVDDLIVEYMIYKVKNGYEPSFTTSEFISFLYFFESKMPVEDVLYENVKLFERFFERKAESDWCVTINYSKGEKEVRSHMDMIYLEKENDYLIKANNKLSIYDLSIINTYFMDGGINSYDNCKGQVGYIRSIIAEYLKNQEKRNIDKNIVVTDDELMVGKCIAANIIINLWEKYINDLVFCHKWPRQCDDINKYLFETDLSEIIGVESIKYKLIEIYNVFSKRIAILYNQDKNLRISTFKNLFLARANYEALIMGYEQIMNRTFSDNKKSFDIDLASLTFKESEIIDREYEWDEDPDVKITNNKIKNPKIKKLIKNLDN